LAEHHPQSQIIQTPELFAQRSVSENKLTCLARMWHEVGTVPNEKGLAYGKPLILLVERMRIELTTSALRKWPLKLFTKAYIVLIR
jgi:hypothetical protein